MGPGSQRLSNSAASIRKRRPPAEHGGRSQGLSRKGRDTARSFLAHHHPLPTRR